MTARRFPRTGPGGQHLTADWLEEHRTRLRDSPVIAAIGYGFARSVPAVQARALDHLVPALQRLMHRNLFTDRFSFDYDPAQVFGLGLASQAAAACLPGFREWLAGVLQDERLQPSDRFQTLLRERARAMLTGQTVVVHGERGDDIFVMAMRYWMARTRTANPLDPDEQHELQARITSDALRTDPDQLPVSRIALVYRVVSEILNASIEQTILNRSHLVTILSRLSQRCAAGATTPTKN